MREIPDPRAVDQTMIRDHRQGRHCSGHGEMGRGQDIESVDFLVTGSRYSPLDGGIRGQDFVKNLPPGCAELFGIVQSMADEISRQDHGRCGDRTGEWPSPRLINPGDPEKAASVKNEFEGQVGHGSIQNPLKRWRVAICEGFTVAKSWVQKTIPSSATTTPRPVWVQELRML